MVRWILRLALVAAAGAIGAATVARADDSAAVDAAGTQQSATFSGAVFTVDQPNAAHSVTRLALHGGDFSKCVPAARRVRPWAAIAASRNKPVRRLFGSGHGRFRTRGRFA